MPADQWISSSCAGVATLGAKTLLAIGLMIEHRNNILIHFIDTLLSDMWYQIFLYCLATTVLMYGLASLLALRALRKHKQGRYIPIVIAVAGLLYPLTGGIVTSMYTYFMNCLFTSYFYLVSYPSSFVLTPVMVQCMPVEIRFF